MSSKDEETRITSLFLKRLAALKREPVLATNAFVVSGLYENATWVFICSEHKDVRMKDEDDAREHFKRAHSPRARLEIS